MELRLVDMPMLLTLWGRVVERYYNEQEIRWSHMLHLLHLDVVDHEYHQFLRILQRATRALEAGGISPDELITTNQTRKALEWLFQQTTIQSNKRAVANAIKTILAKFQ